MFVQANFLLSSVRSSKDESSLWEAAKQHGDNAARAYGDIYLYQCTIMQLITADYYIISDFISFFIGKEMI